MHRLAIDEILAGRGRMHAGERLDQRGFARAVVAEQAMHFAAFQSASVTPLQRDDLAEILADVFEREDDVVLARRGALMVFVSDMVVSSLRLRDAAAHVVIEQHGDQQHHAEEHAEPVGARHWCR